MEFLARLGLASDAELFALAGLAFWLFAGVCAAMEWRRKKRRDYARLEKVGWMPWTSLFVGCAIIGGGMIATSLPVVLGNL